MPESSSFSDLDLSPFADVYTSSPLGYESADFSSSRELITRTDAIYISKEHSTIIIILNCGHYRHMLLVLFLNYGHYCGMLHLRKIIILRF